MRVLFDQATPVPIRSYPQGTWRPHGGAARLGQAQERRTNRGRGQCCRTRQLHRNRPAAGAL